MHAIPVSSNAIFDSSTYMFPTKEKYHVPIARLPDNRQRYCSPVPWRGRLRPAKVEGC